MSVVAPSCITSSPDKLDEGVKKGHMHGYFADSSYTGAI